MLTIVNAKINLGLHVLRKRPDGYHDLETVFYPVGIYNGTPGCPSPFCDVLEINHSPGEAILKVVSDRPVTDTPHRNIVWQAYTAFLSACAAKGRAVPPMALTLAKHIPMQAGLGGGSADASFTLRLLNALTSHPLTDEELHRTAVRLGADCPFFLMNRPALAHGIGERLTPLPDRLKGKWAVVAKPQQTISTAQAFAHIRPHGSEGILEKIYLGSLDQWKELMRNDFEQSFAAMHPECMLIKEMLYATGAFYASLSGSGSAFFGLYHDHTTAHAAMQTLRSRYVPYTAICLL